MRLFPTILFFQLHTVHQSENDRAPGKIKRLKAINYCVDKQVATEDINCFPSAIWLKPETNGIEPVIKDRELNSICV